MAKPAETKAVFFPNKEQVLISGKNIPLRGKLVPPPDKSITHRALFLSALATGKSKISNYSAAIDCQRTRLAVEALGVKIREEKEKLIVEGMGFGGLNPQAREIFAGNSGTTVRLLTGIIAGRDFSVTITGDESLSRRPMRRVIEPLRQMGAKIDAREENYLPLTLQGNPQLKAISYASKVASAQVKSAFILAALQAEGISRYQEPYPTRDHTERMLESLGVQLSREKDHTLTIPGRQNWAGGDIFVPGDFSAAAYFLVAALLIPGSSLHIQGVGLNPSRLGLLTVLRRMGADIKIDSIQETRGEPLGDLTVISTDLKAISLGGELIPQLIDELPLLSVALTQVQGVSRIRDAGELRVKESDRIRMIVENLKKMGAVLEETNDGMIIYGPTVLKGAEINTAGDHRIAMAFTVAGLLAQGKTRINQPDIVGISFPDFWEKLQQLTN